MTFNYKLMTDHSYEITKNEKKYELEWDEGEEVWFLWWGSISLRRFKTPENAFDWLLGLEP